MDKAAATSPFEGCARVLIGRRNFARLQKKQDASHLVQQFPGPQTKAFKNTEFSRSNQNRQQKRVILKCVFSAKSRRETQETKIKEKPRAVTLRAAELNSRGHRPLYRTRSVTGARGWEELRPAQAQCPKRVGAEQTLCSVAPYHRTLCAGL